LDPEKKKELAFAALKDVLVYSTEAAFAYAAKKEVWEEEANRIPVPCEGDLQYVIELVKKVPMVGKTLAKPLEDLAVKLDAAFLDAAVTVCSDPAAKGVIHKAVASLEPTDEMIALCQEPSGAFTKYLVKTTSAAVVAEMKPVVEKVMAGHDVTKHWQSCIKAYNSAAKKLPKAAGVEEMEFDLEQYALNQMLATVEILIAKVEGYVRATPPPDASEAIKKVLEPLCGNKSSSDAPPGARASTCVPQSIEVAPFWGEFMMFRRRFLDARRGEAERIRLVRE